MNFKKTLTAVFAGLASMSAMAQETADTAAVKKVEPVFQIDAQIRPRFELRNGFKRPIASFREPAAFIEQRSRLNLGYTSEKIKVKFSLQDVRIWGSEPQINKTDPLFSAHEVWGEYMITPAFSVKAGRQEINYDNARFYGNLDWAAQGRSHDALLFKYEKGFKLHTGFAFNQNDVNPVQPTNPFANGEGGKLQNTFLGRPVYKHMQYAWFNKKAGGANISLLASNVGTESTVDSASTHTLTLGTHTTYKINDKFSVKGEFYYQLGESAGAKNTAGENMAINALMASLDLNMKFGKAGLTIGGDYMSGTEAGADEVYHFNPLFGTNHKFYGLMDYFFVGNGHQNAGLIDLYLKPSYKVGKNTFMAQLHYFNTAVDANKKIMAMPNYGGNDFGVSNYMGTEIDLVYKRPIAPGVVVVAGYSQFFNTTTIDLLKGITSPQGTNNWAWVMLNINPTIFTTKK